MFYLGKHFLLFWIQSYRRYISGKFLMKRVSCTFHQCESCSAYGLRVAQDGDNFFQVVSLIRGRLRRCNEASLFRVKESLLWGELYQESDAKRVEEKLLLAKESPAAIHAVLLHAARVAKFQQDGQRSRQLAQLAMKYSKQGELSVRNGEQLLPMLSRRLLSFLCWPLGLLCLGVALSFVWGWMWAVSAALSGLWCSQILIRYFNKKKFFTEQLIRLQFLEKTQIPSSRPSAQK